MVMPKQKDMSQKVVGSNPIADNICFREIAGKACLYDHLAVEFVHCMFELNNVSRDKCTTNSN